MLEYLGFSCVQEGGLKYGAAAFRHEEEKRIDDPMAETPGHLDTIRTWQHGISRSSKREAGFCGVPDMNDLCDGEEEDVPLVSIIESLPVLIGSEPGLNRRVEKAMFSHPDQRLTKHATPPSSAAHMHLSGQSVMPIATSASGDFEESDEEQVRQDADFDFGLSDEQLQQLEEACGGPVIRNLTGSTQEEFVWTDSDFGISDRQLQGLV